MVQETLEVIISKPASLPKLPASRRSWLRQDPRRRSKEGRRAIGFGGSADLGDDPYTAEVGAEPEGVGNGNELACFLQANNVQN